MRKKGRIVLVMAAAALLISAFSGCKPKEEARSFASYDEKDYPEYVSSDGYKFATSPIDITVWVNNPSGTTIGWGDDSVSAWIKETLNVNLDLTFASTAGGEELNRKILNQETLADLLVIDPNSAAARQLVEGGYVLALDTLAEELNYPEFLELLPGGMQETFSEEDGHLYHTMAWYGDPENIAQIREEYNLGAGAGDQSLCLNREYYEEMGSPAIDTPDQLYDYLVELHEKHPEVTMPVIPYYVSWNSTKDAVNFFYRMYGGADWLYDDADGNIQICIDDPRYKQALQMMNKMYRAGLFTQEGFTGAYDIITTNLRNKNCFAYIGQDWQWFSLLRDGDKEGSPVLPIETPAVNRDELKLKDLQMSSLGSGPSVYISADCPDEVKRRALEYIAFRYTDECQIAERFGIEGESWERNPNDNMISWTQECKDYEAENGWQAASEKYGYNSALHGWFITLDATLLESTETRYYIQQYNGTLNEKYMQDERIYDLTKQISNYSVKRDYDNFVTIINECIIRCLQAESEEEFESEYQRYVTEAQNAKQDELEAYFTENFQKWKGLGY